MRDLLDTHDALDLLIKTGHARFVDKSQLFWVVGSPSLFEINGSRIRNEDILELVQKAREGQENSYAPHSHFNVGAAILAENRLRDQKIFSGCNIENAAYSPTLCGEITAAAKAVSAGYRRFLAYATVGGFDDSMSDELRAKTVGTYVTPCGRCRQFTKEFDADPCMVIVAPDEGPFLISTLEFLLPAGFGPKNLGVDPSLYDRHAVK
ncbi:MAG: cytidine deaminase [Candidatus Sungbacteria bacterium]|nr:cytidine deaminase [Candidatus Sungbacteria bacterium]